MEKNLTEQLNEELNSEKNFKESTQSIFEGVDLVKINEVSDKDKVALLRTDMKGAVGAHFAEKASDEDLLLILDLTNKRNAAYEKHNKEMQVINKEMDMLHTKYRDYGNNGVCSAY